MNIKQEIHNLNSKLNSIRKKLIKNPKSVRLLHIEMEITDNGNVLMRGPAEVVFEGNISI